MSENDQRTTGASTDEPVSGVGSGESTARADPEESPPASGRTALVQALEVPRYARIGLATGLVVAVGVTVLFVGVLAGGDPTQPAPYYLGLAFVVFVTVSMLTGAVLTGRRALALAVTPASIVRKSATGGLLAGACWLAAGVALAVGSGPTGPAGTLFPWAPLLSLFGVWAVHTRYKRVTPVRPVAALGALLALPGSLAVADLLAVDLPVLVGATPAPFGAAGTRLVFLAGAATLAGGHLLQAGSALLGETGRGLPFAFGLPPAFGVGAFALLGGPAGLAALAAGFGVAHLAVGRQLRRAGDDEVPAAPDTDLAGA